MKDNILIVFGPYDEFHVFNRFNLRLPELKSVYPNYKLIAVVPETASCIITNADEIISFSTDELKKTNSNYPHVLDKMGTMERYNCGYGVSQFMMNSIRFIEAKYNNANIETVLYTNDHQFSHQSYMPQNFKVFKGNGNDADLIHWIFNDFRHIKESIIKGHTILPYIEDFDRIKNRYKDIFENQKAFIFLTRNFKNKQPNIFNTSLHQIELMKQVMDAGYRVVNVGSPCLKLGIQHENYFEIEEDLSYSESLCLFYLSKGVFLRADAGGFSTHACTNNHLFLLTEEWELKDLLYDARKQRSEYHTFKVNSNNIIQCIEESLNLQIRKLFRSNRNETVIDKVNKYDLKNIVNKHSNKDALIVCFGSSINDKDIEQMSKDKIVISCNLWFRHIPICPDYWVFANPDLNMEAMNFKMTEVLSNQKSTIVYADSLDLTDKSRIEEFSKNNDLKFITYDQRHFGGQSCKHGVYSNGQKKCCDNILKDRLTIQELLKKYTYSNKQYSSGDTVAVHMIALAILLGCKNISVIGLDLDYSSGYAKDIGKYNLNGLETKMYETPPSSILEECKQNIYNDIGILEESAKKVNAKITFIR